MRLHATTRGRLSSKISTIFHQHKVLSFHEPPKQTLSGTCFLVLLKWFLGPSKNKFSIFLGFQGKWQPRFRRLVSRTAACPKPVYDEYVRTSNTMAVLGNKAYTLLTPPFMTQHGKPSSRSYRSTFIAINTLLFWCLFARGTCCVNWEAWSAMILTLSCSYTTLNARWKMEILVATCALKDTRKWQRKASAKTCPLPICICPSQNTYGIMMTADNCETGFFI